MQIIYDDKNVHRPGESFRLILLNSGWHVVAQGFLCRVTDEREGRYVIESHRGCSYSNGPHHGAGVD